MLTIRTAATLLAAAPGALEPIALQLGCSRPLPLDLHTQRSLGIDDSFRLSDVRIAAGPGAIRALIFTLGTDLSFRHSLTRLAARLSTHAPHVLWVAIGARATTQEVAIACWRDDRRPPRVSALVARCDRVVDSDAETLCALTAALGGHDVAIHARWIDVLGRDALSTKFYRGLERSVASLAASATVGTDTVREEIALLYTSRLLFLCFLEAKGWLAGDRAFLAHRFELCMARQGRFHDRVLRPLFFGTLNTPVRQRSAAARKFSNIPFLNGGLFARSPVERCARGLAFSDDAYGSLLFDLFGQYRFTAAEESSEWNEAAVDPEMLGRSFESLMRSRERRRTGAFFTPLALVERVTGIALDDVVGRGAPPRDLVVLDPACGSGAFLVHALERIASLVAEHEPERAPSDVRRDVLIRSIFGVDVNPTAVWLCQLRLWLCVVIESDVVDPTRVPPLPNLDRNIRVGDALAGDAFGDGAARGSMHRLRERYTRATGARKRSLGRELDRAERAAAVASIDRRIALLSEHRRDLIVVRRGRDLFGERYRPSRDERTAAEQMRRDAAELRVARNRILRGGALPFSFGVHFGDVAARGGFDAVIGNPPWVRLHRIEPAQRDRFRRDFDVARAPAWQAGSQAAGAGKGFASQIDLAALFIERSLALCAPRGAVSLLVPAKLWHSLAGGGVRRLLASDARLLRIEDYSEAPAAFDAAVYPSLVAARPAPADARPEAGVDVAIDHRGHGAVYWQTALASLAFDDSPGAPWVILPPDARRGFDLLRRSGVTVAESALGRPILGVKCGCNDAFVVTVADVRGDVCDVVAADGSEFTVERRLVRPLLRGETLRRWRADSGYEAILWTHDDSDRPLAVLPPLAAKWFRRWRHALAARSDARNAHRWWSLFRTDAARDDRPRVVWADVGREPRASVLEAGDTRVPLNTCYVVRCPDLVDADAFAALLNSALVRAWLDRIAEPARGGYRRYLGWTLSVLPIPRGWSRARTRLARIGASARAGAEISDADLLDASIAAYGLEAADVMPLIAWTTR